MSGYPHKRPTTGSGNRPTHGGRCYDIPEAGQGTLSDLYLELGVSRDFFTEKLKSFRENEVIREFYLKKFWTYRVQLRGRNLQRFQMDVNRLYHSYKHEMQISFANFFFRKEDYRKYHKIKIKKSPEADEWLFIAALFVMKLTKDKLAELDRLTFRDFKRNPPSHWIENPFHGDPAHKADFDKYEVFMTNVLGNWHTFVSSYETEAHVIVISNHRFYATLDDWLEAFRTGKTPPIRSRYGKPQRGGQPFDPMKIWAAAKPRSLLEIHRMDSGRTRSMPYGAGLWLYNLMEIQKPAHMQGAVASSSDPLLRDVAKKTPKWIQMHRRDYESLK